jgi:hypothetical protein
MSHNEAKELLNKIEEKYQTGLVILKDLFKLSDISLKLKVKEILNDDHYDKRLFDKYSRVDRIISNEVPDRILIVFIETIVITAYGIYFINSHEQEKMIKCFDDFKL